MGKIFLWQNERVRTAAGRPSLDLRLIDDGKIHPAVLIIPGGGYGCVCEKTEGTPTALKFNELGYHAFILDYRTAPCRWPEPQLDAMRAVKIIRANAAKWKINDAAIAVCGFSAGAHLAGSLGTICGDLDASAQDEADGFLHLPDIMILCYGVLSMAEWSHIGSRDNLLGEKALEMAEMCSLPEHVSAMTPPAFLMHTICDQMVPYRNSIEFANAMAAAGRPCELVLNYWGEHGMLLGKNTLDVISWPEQADRFIKSVLASETEPDFLERYTHVYQSRQ